MVFAELLKAEDDVQKAKKTPRSDKNTFISLNERKKDVVCPQGRAHLSRLLIRLWYEEVVSEMTIFLQLGEASKKTNARYFPILLVA